MTHLKPKQMPLRGRNNLGPLVSQLWQVWIRRTVNTLNAIIFVFAKKINRILINVFSVRS